MIISKELLLSTVNSFGVNPDEIQVEMFDKFAQILIEWNGKFNLTAIKTPDEIVIKHFVDSLYIMKSVRFEEKQKLIDVGTGAGFPGLPLLIMNNDLDVTFLDSTGKKLTFIQAVLDELSLKGTTVVGRAEELGQLLEHRERYDFSTARAVSELKIGAELCLPLTKKGGTFIAMKGAKAFEEANEAKNAMKTLGGEIVGKDTIELPSAGERTVFIIKKISQTPTKYPRNYSQISKHPL
ncbi:MAG: 16S rRNA (guanine(527)-N(7))-methyltransferase RsmG [Clostridia bacterium]|nr:16S rRNA (guanine(527)-N(7))-methyltransferase RsmG [Clostridia bacterium]